MADLKIGETYEDRIYITETATGAPKTGLSPTCTIIDEAGNRSAGTVAEMANGWYKVTDFTPDAAGTWCTEWRLANVGYSVHYPFKMFKVSGGYVKDIYDTLTFQHQATASLSQAAPVQNTWYTVLDTTLSCRLILIRYRVTTTGETLEVKTTIDGQTFTGSQAAVADTFYYINALGAGGTLNSSTTQPAGMPFLLEGRSIKVEIRKTTAAGGGTLEAKVINAKR